MAIGPFARIIAQIVVPVVAVLARALPAAYAQALQNARKSGVDAAEAAQPVFGKRISRSEALQVLNLTEEEVAANPEAIQKVRPEAYLRYVCDYYTYISVLIKLTHVFFYFCLPYYSNLKGILQQMMLVREEVFIYNPKYIRRMNC